MKFSQYIKDRVIPLAVNTVCMIALALFLLSVGLQFAEIVIFLVFWIIILLAYWAFSYYQTNKRLNTLYELALNLDKKYLLSEIIGTPINAEEAVYFQILRMAHKSMLEQVSTVGRERKEYKEYIEQWRGLMRPKRIT